MQPSVENVVAKPNVEQSVEIQRAFVEGIQSAVKFQLKTLDAADDEQLHLIDFQLFCVSFNERLHTLFMLEANRSRDLPNEEQRETKSFTPESAKALADRALNNNDLETAITLYTAALAVQPSFGGAEHNLAVAYIAAGRHRDAQISLQHRLFTQRGLPPSKLAKYDPRPVPVVWDANQIYSVSQFKLKDRMQQIDFLIRRNLLDQSFGALREKYAAALEQWSPNEASGPHVILTKAEFDEFGGYFDQLLYFEDKDWNDREVVNPNLAFEGLQDEYAEKRLIVIDDLLTADTISELRDFFLKSTVFFRHSKAGFVGSYVTDGFCCGIILKVVDELRARFNRLIGHLPLNNMWCYRYDSEGVGVRPHNGDGSVTFNFYITPNESNIGDMEGGGMVMYNKMHPPEWDWLTFNMKKDDPDIQQQISKYLADAKSLTVPYRCNRAVVFHSTLFHKTDPFKFRDTYEDRRMNITMLFGKRSAESATLW